jgi:sugar lactone lactonase YvrE
MNRTLIRAAACAAIPVICLGVSTRTWLCSTYSDFEKGELKGVSLRSDGRVTLAPKTTELFDSSLAYLWALARDSKGVLYAGGGPGARVYRFSDDKAEKIAEFDAVEVHALAIDKQDRVYAATFPDGRVYRLAPGNQPGGKAVEFYNPKCKYIWSMLFDPAGNLYIATGDEGKILRVTPDGKGEVFFGSEDTHARTMAFRGTDLIVGTDPTGLVIRVSPEGRGFVLYQLPKREVTAVAVAPDGSIYAAGAGAQQSSGSPGALLAAIVASTAATRAAAGPSAPGAPVVQATPSAEAPAMPRAAALTGGSEVYRIDPSGLPGKVWSDSHDVVYSIAFDRNGHAILGSGNKGTLYRIDSPSLYTALAVVNVNQITALLASPDGAIAAACANVGKVFAFGPGTETEGTVTSEVFDSGVFSSWGRLIAYGDTPQSSVKLESHSGNLDRPRNYWSDWSTSEPPASRFIQWRATLSGNDAHLDSVEQAYLSRNVAPRIEEIEATPANYKFPAPLVASILQRVPQSISLPPIGHHASPSSLSSGEADASSMTWAKGWIGVRWTAADENNDPLTYTLQIRGVDETAWKPLKEKLGERHYSFDSTAFPDGEYRIRVMASDQPGNTAGNALTGELDSSPLLIDNTPPVISGLTSKGSTISWKAADALNIIKRAEYSLDGDDWMLIDPVSHLSDSKTLQYSLTLSGVADGDHIIAVRVTDDYENTSVEKISVH